MAAGICIIAHEPLASALKSCAQHIFSATGDTHCNDIVCFDVPENITAAGGEIRARTLIGQFPANTDILVFTDVLGATPSNIAHRLLDSPRVRVVTGVNLPALITALSNISEPINRVMTLAEGAARSGISTAMGRPDVAKD